MAKMKYQVRLTDEEVEQAKAVVSAGNSRARTIRRANILLMLDENRNSGVKQAKVASFLSVSELTVRKVAQQYQTEGLDSTLTPKRSATQHPPIKLAERECLACVPRRNWRSMDVIELLSGLMVERGCPEYIRSDNGPEFIANKLRA